MTTIDDASSWVEAYTRAWVSNDADDISALFTDDAVYEFRPNDPAPWRGREEIVAGWLEEQDSPEVWKFDFEVRGVLDDGTAVIQAVTEYLDDRPTYENLWLVRLVDGKAVAFTEWFMVRKGTEK